MSRFVLALILALTFSFRSEAHVPKARSWVCVGANQAEAQKLAKVKLSSEFLLKQIRVLKVNSAYCGIPHFVPKRDFCSFEGHHLIVGLKGEKTYLSTNSHQLISLKCEVEDDEIGPTGGVGGSN